MPNIVPKTMEDWMRRRELSSQTVDDRKSDLVARNIADTVDLDDFLWSGRYFRESTTGTTTALGYPEDGAAGTLEVIRNPASVEAQQVFHNRVTGVSWIRWYDGVSWGPWMSGGSAEGGIWQDYTPTTPGTTVGNGSIEGRWTSVGDVIHVNTLLVIGSTTSVAGQIEIGLPVTGDIEPTIGEGWFSVRGVGWGRVGGGSSRYPGHAVLLFNGETFGIVEQGSTNSATRWGSSGPTPNTWSDADRLYATVTYERAL